jgi:hypothetical protein
MVRIPLVFDLDKAKKAGDPDRLELAEGTLQVHDENIAKMLKQLGDAQRALWGLPDHMESRPNG